MMVDLLVLIYVLRKQCISTLELRTDYSCLNTQATVGAKPATDVNNNTHLFLLLQINAWCILIIQENEYGVFDISV